MESQPSLIPLEEEQQPIDTTAGNEAAGDSSDVIGVPSAAEPAAPVAAASSISPAQKKARGRPPRAKDLVTGRKARNASNDANIAGPTAEQNEAMRARMSLINQGGFLEAFWSKGTMTEREFREVVGVHNRGESFTELMGALCATMLGIAGVTDQWVKADDADPIALTLQFTLTDTGRARLVEAGFVPGVMAKWVEKASLSAARSAA